MPRLPATLHARLRAEVSATERIVWMEVPRPGRLRVRAALDLAFALLWNAAVAALISAAAKYAPFLCLFGIPFQLVGLSLLEAPITAVKLASRTLYVVTDRRAIVFEGSEVVSVPRSALSPVPSVSRWGGSGDVVFFERACPGASRKVGFYGVSDAQGVAKLMMEAEP
jgi:hypothetical protein